MILAQGVAAGCAAAVNLGLTPPLTARTSTLPLPSIVMPAASLAILLIARVVFTRQRQMRICWLCSSGNASLHTVDRQ